MYIAGTYFSESVAGFHQTPSRQDDVQVKLGVTHTTAVDENVRTFGFDTNISQRSLNSCPECGIFSLIRRKNEKKKKKNTCV